MKLKKFLSAALAFAVIAAGSASVGAVEDGQATYCFDTAAAMTEWQTFGSTAETGFKMTPAAAESKNGNGSLLISESVPEDVTDKFGGAYVDAATFGLEDFRGCTVEMDVKLCEGKEAFCDSFSLYTDGLVWLAAEPQGLNSEGWTSVKLVIPENAENTQVGFTIPTYTTPFSGDILYIDDFTVTKADGTIAANRGDYEIKKVTEAEKVSQGTNIVLTVALVVLILVIVGGIGIIVSSAIKKFS